jgi:hypothetical protein
MYQAYPVVSVVLNGHSQAELRKTRMFTINSLKFAIGIALQQKIHNIVLIITTIDSFLQSVIVNGEILHFK